MRSGAAPWRMPSAVVLALRPSLDFRLEERRWRIDIDNLTRLALDGLRDGGLIERGLGSLWLLEAHKEASEQPGLDVTWTDATWIDGGHPLRADLLPGLVSLDIEANAIPREGKGEGKRAWRTAVQNGWRDPPVAYPAFVDIWVRTSGSLAGILKPVIDGLEAFLGRDPRGRLS